MRVISLGWGIQSWALATMVALGELPPVDAAVHSDTTWEREGTYRFAREWTPWLEEHGVKVVTVSSARTGIDSSGNKGVMIPAYADNNGKRGQLRRQCTGDWKIAPLRRWLRAQGAKQAEIWLGITTDEWMRDKDSDVKWATNQYPLLEQGMSRLDCVIYLEKNNLPKPPKSACTFCPYRSDMMWAEMKREDGPDWKQSVGIDKEIRDKRKPYPIYLHSRCLPLPDAVQIPEDVGAEQPALFDAECDSGYCWT